MPKEIFSIINSLKNKSAIGYDTISLKTVKIIIPYLTNPLADIFNISLTSSVIPDNLKIAHVLPIYKSGPDDNPINYQFLY